MMNSFCKVILSVFAACAILVLPRLTFSATGSYYYLHVESFRAEKSARISVKNYQRKGITAVIKKEKVAKLGDWYRVYIGPFPSRQAAKQKATELKKKGIIDYAAIKRQDLRVATTTAISVPVVKKEVKTPPQKPVSKVQQPQPAAGPSKPPPQPPVAAKATTKVTPPPAPKKVKPRPPIRTIRGGKGRNVAGGSVVFGFTHIYREINTELTERLVNGVPTNIDDIKNDFPTTMNQDTLSLTLGVTDYFQIFAQGGIAYDELSDPGFVYGGGLRINLFQTTSDSILPGFYAALHAAYLSGEFEEEFESIAGNKFEKELEWQELSAGIEIGISRRGWDIYVGGNYFDYSEETERRRVDLLIVIEDELEQENDFGVYGGFTILLSKSVALNIEGQALAQEAVLASLEFKF